MNNLKLHNSFTEIIEIARFSPSVHNTQPWKISHLDDKIIVEIDKAHSLISGDPTGRQTTISLGILFEAIVLAAAKYELYEESSIFDENRLKIKFKEHKKCLISTDDFDISLIKSRSTDRSLYKPVDITEDIINKLKQSNVSSKINIEVVSDEKSIDEIALLTSKGIKLALSNPEFRNELSRYLVLPGSSKKRGISVNSLYINPLLALIQPLLIKFGVGINAESNLEKARWESASAVILICADGDLSEYWLEAGRAYLRLSLTIEAMGLSQATTAAIVEASNYHDDIESLLNTNQRILSAIRIGKGKSNRFHSPRLAAKDLIT